MYAHIDYRTDDISTGKDYDHYKVDIGTKADYIAALGTPTYFDFTSPITKDMVLSNSHFISELLQSRDWATFVERLRRILRSEKRDH